MAYNPEVFKSPYYSKRKVLQPNTVIVGNGTKVGQGWAGLVEALLVQYCVELAAYTEAQ